MAALTPGWRLGGGDLPGNLHLAARLLVLCLLWQQLPGAFDDPFLPFHPIFDELRGRGVFAPATKALFLAGAFGLFLSKRARASCLLVGAAMLLNILGSKAFFSNGKTFYTAQFLLLGLYTPESGTRFLRAQFVLVYLGCGLSKALDPDWWSGQYFENWFARRVEHGPYMAAAALLPPPRCCRRCCFPS